MTMRPNNSPEPPAVGAVNSDVAIMRFLKRHSVLAALALGIVAEGVCVAVLSLPESNLFVGILRSIVSAFHLIPGVVYFFFPDVIDGYATERQEFIVTSICFTIAWLQWFLIFLGGIHIFREHNENLAA